MNGWKVTGLIALAVMVLALAMGVFLQQPKPLPDFKTYQQTSEKKKAFFAFLQPLVEQENKVIFQQRSELISLKNKMSLTPADLKWLKQMAMFYRVDNEGKTIGQVLDALLMRVDIIPVSLALSQSANESAWGTSRFAVEGNNLFGQWCYREGCGLIPANRSSKARHEVARYASPSDSVRSYLYNLNTHKAYQSFRELRWQQRQQQKKPAGSILVAGLQHYSSRGEAYIRELKTMMRSNQLDQYDH